MCFFKHFHFLTAKNNCGKLNFQTSFLNMVRTRWTNVEQKKIFMKFLNQISERKILRVTNLKFLMASEFQFMSKC